MRQSSFFSIAALFLASSCATSVTTTIPATHFVTSETGGKLWSGHLEGGINDGSRLTIIPDAIHSPANLNSTSMDDSMGIDAQLWLGILNRLDLQLIDQNLMYGFKVQFLGEPRKTAQLGDVSGAFAFRYGSISGTEQYKDNTLILPTNRTASATLNETTYDLLLIAGCRVLPDASLLLYGGPFFSRRFFNGTLTQDPGDGTAKSYVTYSGSMDQAGMSFGGSWGPRQGVFSTLEFSAAYGVGSNAHRFGGFVGAAGGYQW